jgi:hypothetical protein
VVNVSTREPLWGRGLQGGVRLSAFLSTVQGETIHDIADDIAAAVTAPQTTVGSTYMIAVTSRVSSESNVEY